MAAGYTLVMPEVGELVTSLDMSGVSLTVTWLDDELEPLWTAPAETPAYRRGTAAVQSGVALAEEDFDGGATVAYQEATAVSRAYAADCIAALEAARKALHEAESVLGAVDAVGAQGSGHSVKRSGTTRYPGPTSSARRSRRSRTGSPAWARLKSATRPWLTRSCRSRRHSPGWCRKPATPHRRGPKPPTQPQPPPSTASLRPLKGRARPLAEKSLGTADPGATSLAMIFTVMGPHFTAVRQPAAAVL